MIAELWVDMGFIRLPLSFSLLVVVLLALWSTAQLVRGEPAADQSTKAWIDAILFWGLFAGVTGVLGHARGDHRRCPSHRSRRRSLQRAGVAGVQVALLSSVFARLILGLAALLWFALQLSWRLLAAESEAHAHAGFVG